jgi:phage terminase large subunit
MHDRIETPQGGVVIFMGMQDHTAESIKSLEGFRIAWVEEAQTLSAKSLELLRPTIRSPGSQMYFQLEPAQSHGCRGQVPARR